MIAAIFLYKYQVNIIRRTKTPYLIVQYGVITSFNKTLYYHELLPPPENPPPLKLELEPDENEEEDE